MSSSRNLLAASALLALSGCGFSPLYGGDDGGADVAQQLDQIQVANIPERPGQMLREALEGQLHADGAPTVQLYSLNVAYSIADAGIGIQEDSSTTRNRFTATATWTLTPVGNPLAPLTKGQASTEDALNVLDQQYFASTLETDTINQQLANDISQQIDTQVAAYFKSHPAS